MPYSVCIDIGGTFTDAIVLDPGGALRIFKVPTTPPRFEHGFMAALTVAAEAFGLGIEAFLADTDMIVHGTTISTNALVEQKVGRCGLLVTAGHPDILLLREGPRKRTFDWSVDYPDAFVPAHLTREIRGVLMPAATRSRPSMRATCGRRSSTFGHSVLTRSP